MKKNTLYLVNTNLDISQLPEGAVELGVDQNILSGLGSFFKESTGQEMWPCMELLPNGQNIIFRDLATGGMQWVRSFKPSEIDSFHRILYLVDYDHLKTKLPAGKNYIGVLGFKSE